MDFRSQLSAFKNKSSNDSNNAARDLKSEGGRNPSNNYGSTGNYGSNNNSHGNHRHGSSYRGGGTHDGGYEGHRRRNRPHEWGRNTNYHQGLPTTRRRFHPPRHGSPGHGYGQPSLDGLDDMRNLGYRIRRGFPPPSNAEEKKKKSRHLALLAISIDDLPYEDIWKGWCDTLSSSMENNEEVDEYFISLVCHAKFPQNVKSEWLRQRLLTCSPKQGRGNSFMDPVYLSRKPEWGSVEITRAMLDVLQDGLKIGYKSTQYEDKRFCPSRYVIRYPPSFNAAGSTPNTIPPVDQFLFISESCLPVVTAPEFFSKVSDTTISWLNARHRTETETPKNKYEDDQFAGINRRIPGQYRWKGDQWVLLCQRHASSIIGIDRPFKPPKHQLWQSFRQINASDEMYFPTALALLGDLRYTKGGHDTQKGRSREEESSDAGDSNDQNHTNHETDSNLPLSKNQSIVLKPVTYTDWTEGMRNPATFSNGSSDFKRVSKLARDMGCLVARKFATHVNIPGIPLGEQKLTGCISMEDWEFVMKEIKDEEGRTSNAVKEGNLDVATPNRSDNLDDTETNDCAAEDNHRNDGDDKTEGQEGKEIAARACDEGNDDDNDDEENQLD